MQPFGGKNIIFRRKASDFQVYFLKQCLFFRLCLARENQVENHADKCRQSDALKRERTDRPHCAADAESEHNGNDDDVAGDVDIHLITKHVLHTNRGYRPEEKEHDAAENSLRNCR